MCVAPLFAEVVTAPSLKQGAVISISNGVLSRKDAKTYIRKYKNSPEPCSITLVVREVMPLKSIECYLDSAGLKAPMVEDFGQVPVMMYVGREQLGEILLNAAAPANGSGATYYLRNKDRYKADFLERGGGAGAVIKFLNREGNMWLGIINGCFFSPQDKLSYQFKDAPCTIELPKEGSTIDELAAAALKTPVPQEDDTLEAAPVEDAAPEPPPVAPVDDVVADPPSPVTDAAGEPGATPAAPQAEEPFATTPEVKSFELNSDTAQDIIRKRLNMIVSKPVDEALMQAFFAEKVTRLTDGKVVDRKDIIAATARMVETWPRRGVYLIGAGHQGQRLEMLIVFSFSDGKGKEDARYGRITFDFDAAGQACGMSEEYDQKKHKLSPGFTPIQYQGEKTVVTVE